MSGIGPKKAQKIRVFELLDFYSVIGIICLNLN